MKRISSFLWSHKITVTLLVCVASIVTYNSLVPPPQHYHARIADFSDGAFETAQSQGLPILVDVYATWCPVCKSQGKSLTGLIDSEARLEDMVFFRVNIDTQPDAVARFNASRQSTLVAFRGKTEVGRLIGETKREKIWELMATAVDPEGFKAEHRHDHFH